jgi:hypothetical protein
MDKKIIGGVVLLLALVVGGYFLLQQPKPEVKNAPAESSIKKVDLATQPEWVQKLKVSGKKGRSANGLDNMTLSVTGIEATSLTYVLEYQTSNKGTQGALAMSPQSITGKSFTKTIDFGTCSTKSCVRHDGVTSVLVELDFNDSSIWTGSVDLK